MKRIVVLLATLLLLTAIPFCPAAAGGSFTGQVTYYSRSKREAYLQNGTTGKLARLDKSNGDLLDAVAVGKVVTVSGYDMFFEPSGYKIPEISDAMIESISDSGASAATVSATIDQLGNGLMAVRVRVRDTKAAFVAANIQLSLDAYTDEQVLTRHQRSRLHLRLLPHRRPRRHRRPRLHRRPRSHRPPRPRPRVVLFRRPAAAPEPLPLPPQGRPPRPPPHLPPVPRRPPPVRPPPAQRRPLPPRPPPAPQRPPPVRPPPAQRPPPPLRPPPAPRQRLRSRLPQRLPLHPPPVPRRLLRPPPVPRLSPRPPLRQQQHRR